MGRNVIKHTPSAVVEVRITCVHLDSEGVPKEGHGHVAVITFHVRQDCVEEYSHDHYYEIAIAILENQRADMSIKYQYRPSNVCINSEQSPHQHFILSE